MALGADWCRNAYGARQSVDLHEVTRSRENPMRTIASIALHRRWRGARATYIATNATHCLEEHLLPFAGRVPHIGNEPLGLPAADHYLRPSQVSEIGRERDCGVGANASAPSFRLASLLPRGRWRRDTGAMTNECIR